MSKHVKITLTIPLPVAKDLERLTLTGYFGDTVEDAALTVLREGLRRTVAECAGMEIDSVPAFSEEDVELAFAEPVEEWKL